MANASDPVDIWFRAVCVARSKVTSRGNVWADPGIRWAKHKLKMHAKTSTDIRVSIFIELVYLQGMVKNRIECKNGF